MNSQSIPSLLIVIILLEVIAGAGVLGSRLLQKRPLLDGLEALDDVTATEIRTLVENDWSDSEKNWAELGDLYTAYGLYPEAVTCFTRAFELDAKSPTLAFSLAFAVGRVGQVERAIELFQRAITLRHPKPATCWYFLGRSFLRLENADAARQAFSMAEKELPVARYDAAHILVRSGAAEEALPRLEALEKQFPAAAEVLMLRARAERQLGRVESATVYEDRAHYASGELPSPFREQVDRLYALLENRGLWLRWARCLELAAQSKWPQAENTVRGILKVSPWPEALFFLGEANLRAGNPDAAVRFFEQLIEKDGLQQRYLKRLGDAHAAMQNSDRARESWQRALRMPPTAQPRTIFDRLRKLARDQGDEDRAARNYASGAHALGVDAIFGGEFDQATKAFEQAVEVNPRQRESWFYLGEATRLRGQSARAREAYQRCLELDPDHGRARRGLAILR
jgi:protein O-GlcNAc transferase